MQSNYIIKHTVWFSLLVFVARLLEEGSKYVGLHSDAKLGCLLLARYLAVVRHVGC